VQGSERRGADRYGLTVKVTLGGEEQTSCQTVPRSISTLPDATGISTCVTPRTACAHGTGVWPGMPLPTSQVAVSSIEPAKTQAYLYAGSQLP
jgi:hypothetical protein